jgi:hypothetical protein
MYDEYFNRIGVVTRTAGRVEYGTDRRPCHEAIIRRDELIPREMFRYGDRVRAYVPGRVSAARRISFPHASAVRGQALHAGSARDL